MKGLLLDTSSNDAIIALSSSGKIIHSFVCSSKISSTLSSHIQKLLKEADVSLQQLNYIAIGIGPGSFLGTRIGVITAKSLSYGLKIPLVSFCSLQAYQSHLMGEFYVISDAKSKGVYLLKGVKTADSLIYEETPSLYTAEELQNLIHKDSVLVTPHKEAILDKMPFLNGNLNLATPSLPYLCEYCYEKLSLSQIETLDSLSIHYLRLS